MESTDSSNASPISIVSVREALIRMEDTIVFTLIERSKFPLNFAMYDESLKVPGFSGSMLEYFVKETEVLQAKIGRYENPEEHPFFPDGLPLPLVPPENYPQVLHPAAATINMNKTILEMYINELLPLFAGMGEDGNYASAAACDLACLQALSRRIHYGMYVAEVKYREASEEYGAAIRAEDRKALMKLLTFKEVEEMVKRRVAEKAMVFGQDVTLNMKMNVGKCKVNPSVVSRLYEDWVIPFTKIVEVDYLLCRLD
ncbi:chorismate mutase 2-like [Aristolochia californica]|uniref:chorismate mutase 2-like n=1 Tax=Aristolochia californica TaxID=171875 RepID=UPI0035E11331